MAFTRVCDRDSLWRGEMRGITVGAVAVVVIDVDGELHAFEDRCAHQRVKLSEGRLDGCVLTCRAHDWCYDLASGRGLNPTGVTLRRFPVRVEHGAVWVDVEAPSAHQDGAVGQVGGDR
jgi:toluene monooxygenase system ferredoxin subunit